VLSGAAILQVGATFTTPARGQTIGEAWLRVMADWIKVTLVLVVPLFLGAAVLEVFVTPHFAIWLLGGGMEETALPTADKRLPVSIFMQMAAKKVNGGIRRFGGLAQ
jgi:hypothetical protein